MCHNTQLLLRHVVGHPPPHGNNDGWLLGPQIGPKFQISGLMVSTPPHMVGAQGPRKGPPCRRNNILGVQVVTWSLEPAPSIAK